jgi:hypothetical protein
MPRALPVLSSSPFALEDLAVASPCSASWADMRPLQAGDERVRHCGLCDKNVYNLSGMTRREATAFVADREGSVCIRMYRRTDGTVLTADCPVGVRAALLSARRRARRELAFAAATTMTAVGALLAFLGAPPRKTCAVPASDPVPTSSTGPLMGAVPAPPPEPTEAVMGEMAPSPPPDAHVVMGDMVASPPPKPTMGRLVRPR